MATGKRPYPEGDASRLMKMIRAGNIPDPVEKAPDLPDALRAFILRACRRDPAGRPRTMREAMEPLLPLAEKFDAARKSPGTPGRKSAAIFLTYDEERQCALDRLLEDFSARLEELGIDIKTTKET
ncbi:MAG: serine/threonine protein kinase, partial [Desulfobacterales bacterium]|nr:serine/threonine protein kinase [Desulfobacterales bacterium]